MNNPIDLFLHKRNERLQNIEIASTLHKEIGEKLPARLFDFHDEITPTDDGYIYQLLTYMQKNCFYVLFNEFIAIIGSIEKKTNILKSWQPHNLPEEYSTGLREIFKRYAEIRNNFISHIGDKHWDEVSRNTDITYEQVTDDVDFIRKILNHIRVQNGIPAHMQAYDASETYQILGIKKVFSLLYNV
jgi:hypothetical protein